VRGESSSRSSKRGRVTEAAEPSAGADAALDGSRLARRGSAETLDRDGNNQMTETGLAIFVLAAFVIPVPLLTWLDRKPRRG